MLLQPAELEALAGKALKAALAEEQYARGVIIDGLNSQYLSPDLAAHLLLTSLGLQRSCKLRPQMNVTPSLCSVCSVDVQAPLAGAARQQFI